MGLALFKKHAVEIATKTSAQLLRWFCIVI